jgi:hypothetical protein
LTIANGSVTASVSQYGAGIGTGETNHGSATIEYVTISTGNVTAIVSKGGSGIGTGHDVTEGRSGIGHLTVLD